VIPTAENWSTPENHTRTLFCPSQIPHELAWDWTYAFAVGTQELIYSVFWVITRRKMVRNWRFGTSCRFYLQGPSCPRRTVWPLKVKPIGCPETPVSNRLTPRNNLEDGIIYFNGGGCPRWSQGLPAWTMEGRRKVNSFVMTSFLCSCI
jgi:hypothetical protein